MSSPNVFLQPSNEFSEKIRRRSSSSSFHVVSSSQFLTEPTIRIVASPESSPSLSSSSRHFQKTLVQDDFKHNRHCDQYYYSEEHDTKELPPLPPSSGVSELEVHANMRSIPQRRLPESSSLSRAVGLITFPPSFNTFLSDGSSSRRLSTSTRTDSSSESTICTRQTFKPKKGPDSRHRKHSSSVDINDKFTQKWPRPRSLKKMDVKSSTAVWTSRKGLSTIDKRATISTLEGGLGLGVDRMDKWTGFKWCLIISVGTVLCYGAAAMVCAILTWFRTWDHADVMYVADNDILILITLSASTLLFTALLGLTGALLNSRPILAIYALLLWPALISILVVGYSSYKRWAFALDHKLNFSWSQYYTPLGRLLIQNSLRCCGYYNPLHEATPSGRCYPRTSLPGCKGKLYRFERENLYLIWSTTFSLVALHIINIVAALLCSNHVTKTFGKGITPKRYRLDRSDLRANTEKILEEMSRMKVERVSRPEYSRASSSATVFREDREERISLLGNDRR